MHLQPAQHVRRVVTSKVARPTYSWDAGVRIINAELHRILCTTITRHGSNFSHYYCYRGHAPAEVGRIDTVCNLSRRRPPRHGWSHHPATTHEAAAIVQAYFLMVGHRTSLLVADQYWIAEVEVADVTRSIRSNFGCIVRPLISDLPTFFSPDSLPAEALWIYAGLG